MGRSLEKKVALVTGASSGVGWMAALALAEEGVKLCVTARREAPLQALAREIHRGFGACIAHPADVTDEAEVKAVVDACLRHYGQVDLLVNNAGVQSYGWFWDYAPEELERMMDTNFFGYTRFARHVLPHFRARGEGTLINVASMLSRGAAPLLSGYVASKHAILGWSESLRLELYGTGIEVGALLLPSVSTPMFDHAPTHLGLWPKPVPPTYDTRLAGRAVVAMAKRPRPQYVPVFLQGRLLLWAQAVARPLTDWVMGTFGERLQVQKGRSLERPEGNLYAPVAAGTGPYGSVPPTPKAKRALGLAALLALAGAAAAGVGLGARRLL